jgi:hypothetical protein
MKISSSRKEESHMIAPKVSLETYIGVYKSVCKIFYEKIVDGKRGIENGTGFFMKINKELKYLFTCNHILSKDIINESINIKTHNKKKIKFELKNRNIEVLEILDITMIEIKENDEFIKDIDFLDYDSNYIKGYDEEYRDKEIFALQYPREKIEVASGKIKEIMEISNTNYYEFEHNIDIDKGSFGSPIILASTLKVIGIHKKCANKINYGTFIGEIFKNKNLNTKLNLKNLINEKDNVYNNNYIIGEIYISKDNINKNIRIINSYEEDC